MLYYSRARNDKLFCCDNIYYRSIFICHSITLYCISSNLSSKTKLLSFLTAVIFSHRFSKDPCSLNVCQNALTQHARQRGDERQMLLHVSGRDGKEAGEAGFASNLL